MKFNRDEEERARQRAARKAEIRAELRVLDAQEEAASTGTTCPWTAYRVRTYDHWLRQVNPAPDEEGYDPRLAHRWEAYLHAAGLSDQPSKGQDQSVLVELYDGDTRIGVVAAFYKGRLIWESDQI